MNKRELFAQLPSVDEMLNQEMIIEALNEYPRNILLEGIRESIEEKRKEIIDLKEDFEKFNLTIDEVVKSTMN